MGLFGGGSSSSASTTNTDARVVADAQGQGASMNGLNAKDQGVAIRTSGSSNADITLTDMGAVKAAIELVSKTMDKSNQSVQDLLGVQKSTFDQQSTSLKDAYADSKGGATRMQNISIAMLATLAAIAYFYFSGKK